MEIIHLTSGDYPKYESLLLRRDQLKKDALHYRRSYIKEFGELINKIFEKKIRCIELKKSISFCMLSVNQGKKTDMTELKIYIELRMSEYHTQLNDMISELNSTKHDGTISAQDVKEIKSIYRKIARRLHPDLSSVTEERPELYELWQQVSIAYKCNDLKALSESDFLIERALQQLGVDCQTSVIPDIAEKIATLEADIQKIITTEPYTYKLILEDPYEISEKKEMLKLEYQQYCDYEKNLKIKFDKIIGGK